MKSRVLVAAFLSVLAVSIACSSGRETPPGTDLGGQPAADFRLTSATGAPVSLADYRGRPVALTFLYTRCPDVCPVIAQRLGEALARMGKDGEKVAVLAVSVDPAGDTPEAARAFMAAHRLTGPDRHFLLGDASTLEPIRRAYGIASESISPGQGAGEPPQMGMVGHTDAIFLIDRDGRQQRLLRGDATADEMTRGLRSLLR